MGKTVKRVQALVVSLLQIRVLRCGWFSATLKFSSSHTADHSGHKALNESWIDRVILLHKANSNQFWLSALLIRQQKIKVIYNLEETPVWPVWPLDARFFQNLPGADSRYTYTMYMFLTTSPITLKSCRNVRNRTAKSSHRPSILNKSQNYWFRVWYRKEWLRLPGTPFFSVFLDSWTDKNLHKLHFVKEYYRINLTSD